MKVSATKHETMKNAIRKVVECCGPNLVRKAILARGEKRVLWDMFNLAMTDMKNDDTHPTYKNRERMVPTNPGFDPYSDGDNDTHLTTALSNIAHELDLID